MNAGYFTYLRSIKEDRPLRVLFFAYAVTLVVFFTSVRIRLPLITILIPLIPAGIDELVSRIKDKEFVRVFMFAYVVLLFSILACVPVKGSRDITGHLNTHATLLSRAGRDDEAVKYWKRSSETDGAYSGYADLSLAGVAISEKEPEKALCYIKKVDPDSFMAADKYRMKGDFFRMEKQYVKAVEAYMRSLEINSGQRRVWRDLIFCKKRLGRIKAAKLDYRKYESVCKFY